MAWRFRNFPNFENNHFCIIEFFSHIYRLWKMSSSALRLRIEPSFYVLALNHELELWLRNEHRDSQAYKSRGYVCRRRFEISSGGKFEIFSNSEAYHISHKQKRGPSERTTCANFEFEIKIFVRTLNNLSWGYNFY